MNLEIVQKEIKNGKQDLVVEVEHDILSSTGTFRVKQIPIDASEKDIEKQVKSLGKKYVKCARMEQRKDEIGDTFIEPVGKTFELDFNPDDSIKDRAT